MGAETQTDLDRMLTRLKLTAVRDQLDTLLDEAARSEMTLRDALAFLCQREIARKDQRRIDMSFGLAKFPFVRDLAGFDFAAQPSIDKAQIRDLATGRFIANGDALLLLGPPGVGKTQVSIPTPGLMPRGRRRSSRLRRRDRGSDPVPGMPETGSGCLREPGRFGLEDPERSEDRLVTVTQSARPGRADGASVTRLWRRGHGGRDGHG
jgi:IstB-like ATP binding protein